MSITGMDSTVKMLEKLGNEIGPVAEYAVGQAAGVIADSVRDAYEVSLQGSDYSTGDMMDSFGVTPARQNRDGSIDVKVGFSGYDSKGVPNQLKARARESGTSRQVKRPVFRPAVNRVRRKARDLMEHIVYVNVDKLTKG